MGLDVATAPEGVRRVLTLAGWPDRRMGLTCRSAGLTEAESVLRALEAEPSVLAGLWLYCGGFDESHSISQDLSTPEGSYWHAMLHRQEPDDWNSGYWFKRVGRHPIFQELARLAVEAGYAAGEEWDPEAFIRLCAAGRREGGGKERMACEVQHLEFQLLLAWCIGHGRMK